MSFGFSIGDVITVTGIAFNVCESIRSFPADHIELVLQLDGFRCFLQDIKEVMSNCQLSQSTAKITEQQLSNCHKLLQELEKTITKYENILGGKHARLKQIRWGLYKKDDSMKLVDKLRNQMNYFNLFLNTYNTKMSQETGFMLKWMAGNTPRALDTWSDFEPIRFIDALNRQRTFDFEMCRTREAFHELLKASFHESAGRAWVDTGRYMIADESTGLL